MMNMIKTPFSYFGNKRQITDIAWSRLGTGGTYIEPFFGSGAMFLSRPNPSGIELINDADGFVINAFRSMTYSPDKTAELVAHPPSEIDIIARHRWLMEIGKPKLEQLKTDPFYHDPQIAAFWIYGACTYVGGGWCDGKGYKNQEFKIPKHTREGVFRVDMDGDVEAIKQYFHQISTRMRNTKIACGDWTRVVTPAWLNGNGTCLIFLDPPYSDEEHTIQYAAGGNVAQDVRKWAIENGENDNLRIIVCGYEADNYQFPPNWETVEWKANGGYGNQGDGQGRINSKRERLWCSPHCLKVGLFSLINSDSPEEPIYDHDFTPPTTSYLPDDIKVSVTSVTNTPSPPISILSKETPVKQSSTKPKYAQMSIFDLMNE